MSVEYKEEELPCGVYVCAYIIIIHLWLSLNLSHYNQKQSLASIGSTIHFFSHIESIEQVLNY